MKNYSKIIVLSLVSILVLPSCRVRFVNAQTGRPLVGPQGSYGTQGGHMGPGGRSLKPYYPSQQPAGRVQTGTRKVQTGTKKVEIAYFEARLWGSEDEGLKKQATDYTARYFEKHRCSPSNEEVSKAIGHKCQVQIAVSRTVDIPPPPADGLLEELPSLPELPEDSQTLL